MTRQEAREKGFAAQREKYGPDFHRVLGAMGGRPRNKTIEELMNQPAGRRDSLLIAVENKIKLRRDKTARDFDSKPARLVEKTRRGQALNLTSQEG